MSLKKLFVIVVAVAIGVTIALAAIIGTWLWWDQRPKARDTAALLAEYEQPVVSKDKDGGRILELRYALRNATDHDITVSDTATVYIRRDDNRLIDLKRIVDYQLEDVTIPAGDTVLYFLNAKLPYHSKDCKVQPVDDPTAKQLSEFVAVCYDWIKGFVLILGSENLRVEMPLNQTKRKS